MGLPGGEDGGQAKHTVLESLLKTGLLDDSLVTVSPSDYAARYTLGHHFGAHDYLSSFASFKKKIWRENRVIGSNVSLVTKNT